MLYSDVASTMIEVSPQQAFQEERIAQLSRQNKGLKPNWVQRINDALTPTGTLAIAISYLGRPRQF